MGGSRSKNQQDDEQFLFTSKGNLHDYYDIVEQIGVGKAGLILKAIDKKSGKSRTIKEFSHYKMLTGIKDDLDRQINILKKTDHPNVINIFEVCKAPFADYLVYEHLEGQSLMELILIRLEEIIQKKEENELFNKGMIESFMKDILFAISYCYNQKIVHNDICPDNFVFVEQVDTTLEASDSQKAPRIKLIDFGIAFEEKDLEILKQREFNRKYGQSHFRAPETFHDDYQKSWTFEDVSKRDVWGAGVIFYILLTGKPLVLGRKKAEVNKNLKDLVKGNSRELKDEVFNGIEVKHQELLKKMLEIEPKYRISAQKALDYFEEKFEEQSIKGLIETLENIKNFNIEQKIDKKFRSLVVSHLIKDEYTKGIEFRQLDADRDGFISENDLEAIWPKINLSNSFSSETSESFTRLIMEKCDWNNDGKISYREFLTASLTFKEHEAENFINEITNFFDIFRNGYLTESQLKRLIKGVEEEQWEEFIKKVDKDENGLIDTDELRDYLLESVIKNK